MGAPELPFEYCALNFLRQWAENEKTLHEQFAGNPPVDGIRSALGYFQVARTFKGVGSDEKVQTIADALHQVDGDSHPSPEAKVLALASRFKENFGKTNLSAASKLLWLKHRAPYVIFDSRAVAALRRLDRSFRNADYHEYCKCWRQQYDQYQPTIRDATARLHEANSFLRSPPKEDLADLVSQAWFLERVFDTYLWEIGGKG